MKKNILYFLFLFYQAIYTQEIGFEFDYAQFGYDSSSNFVEFYYVFDQSKLRPILLNDKSFIKAILKVTISDTVTNDTIVNNQWLIQHPLNTEFSLNQSLVGLISFILPEGIYKCVFEGIDANLLTNKKLLNEFIEVKAFKKNRLSISDIQVASKMIQGSENKQSIFYKNTFEIIPNPNLLFGENQAVLFFYAELYNLKDDRIIADNLKLHQVILNSRGNIVIRKEKIISRNTDTRVEVGTFVLSKLPTDTYTIIISVIDTIKNTGVNSAKRFFVYNPNIAETESTIPSIKPAYISAFGAMSEEELDDIFLKSKYIATTSEIEKYQKLIGEKSKQEFLFNFWNSRDQDPSTPENEFFSEYIKRIEIANSRYNSLQKPGWKTDRGRIYIIYGEPSEIERFPNQIESRPYEIWYYNELEGGVFFIFADLTNFSEYTLLHSTKRGELRDDNWTRRVIIAK